MQLRLKSKFSSLGLAGVTLLLGGCSDSGDKPEPEDPRLSDMQGAWESPCTSVGDFFQRQNVIVTDSSASFISTYATSDACDVAILTTSLHGDFTIGAVLEDPDTANALAFVPDMFTGEIVLEDDEVIASINAMELFGFSNWAFEEPKGLFGVDEAAPSGEAIEQGETLYTIYRRDDDTFEWAGEFSHEEADRPDELSPLEFESQ
jgi:hypothetical protein